MGARRGRPPGRTAQGEATRARLFEVAVRRFATHGWEGTTMRDIADDAGVSAGLLYRYFPSKAAVVLALYDDRSTAFATRAAALEGGSWFARCIATLRLSLATLDPHRDVLRSALGPLLVDPDAGLLSAGGAGARAQVRGAFLAAVTGADHPPDGPLADALGRLADVVQLAFLLGWVVDRTPDQRATHALVEVLAGLERPVTLALWVPGAGAAIRRVADLVDAMLYGQGGERLGEDA
ncbi:MAG: TetR/AcrR family transcriptional regulator [Alphaproteobacteria bacterium]|nr:TetR/AcrR family transcriptional regulator [Alphaproteobacteria bacterium]